MGSRGTDPEPLTEALCGDVSEYITHVPNGKGERVGVICALLAFHANPYHATADGRHEWHVDDPHWIRALEAKRQRIADLEAALRDADKTLTACQAAFTNADNDGISVVSRSELVGFALFSLRESQESLRALLAHPQEPEP